MTIRGSILILVSLGLAQAHDVTTTKITYSAEVSRLVYKRCASCHHEGGSSFSLMTYDAARPWAKAIKEEAESRRMPPWQAVKGFGEFKDDRGLTQEEIELLSDWVEGGAPEGDPRVLPEAPKPSQWLDPATPAGAVEKPVAEGARFDSASRVVAIRAKDLAKGSTVQVLAMRPDGSVEPLVWIYQYNPDFERTYYYREPVNLPAGTRIMMSPPNAGSVELFTAPVAASPKAGAR